MYKAYSRIIERIGLKYKVVDAAMEISAMEEVYTPNIKTIEKLSNFLKEPPQKIIKTIVVRTFIY